MCLLPVPNIRSLDNTLDNSSLLYPQITTEADMKSSSIDNPFYK